MNVFSLRHLAAADWEIYRDIRLEALRNHPAYFSPSRDETSFSESDWRERLGNVNAATFGLFAQQEIIGITGIVREPGLANAERAYLVGTYIKKNFRRQGLAERLFKVRMEWAREQKGIKTLVLEHREDNLPVRKAHQKFGFRFSGSKNQLWADGTISACLIYEWNVL